MAIQVAGKVFRTLADEFFVNGAKVLEAWQDGVKVYPESDGKRYVTVLTGSHEYFRQALRGALYDAETGDYIDTWDDYTKRIVSFGAQDGVRAVVRSNVPLGFRHASEQTGGAYAGNSNYPTWPGSYLLTSRPSWVPRVRVPAGDYISFYPTVTPLGGYDVDVYAKVTWKKREKTAFFPPLFNYYDASGSQYWDHARAIFTFDELEAATDQLGDGEIWVKAKDIWGLAEQEVISGGSDAWSIRIGGYGVDFTFTGYDLKVGWKYCPRGSEWNYVDSWQEPSRAAEAISIPPVRFREVEYRNYDDDGNITEESGLGLDWSF